MADSWATRRSDNPEWSECAGWYFASSFQRYWGPFLNTTRTVFWILHVENEGSLMEVVCHHIYWSQMSFDAAFSPNCSLEVSCLGAPISKLVLWSSLDITNACMTTFNCSIVRYHMVLLIWYRWNQSLLHVALIWLISVICLSRVGSMFLTLEAVYFCLEINKTIFNPRTPRLFPSLWTPGGASKGHTHPFLFLYYWSQINTFGTYV